MIILGYAVIIVDIGIKEMDDIDTKITQLQNELDELTKEYESKPTNESLGNDHSLQLLQRMTKGHYEMQRLRVQKATLTKQQEQAEISKIDELLSSASTNDSRIALLIERNMSVEQYIQSLESLKTSNQNILSINQSTIDELKKLIQKSQEEIDLLTLSAADKEGKKAHLAGEFERLNHLMAAYEQEISSKIITSEKAEREIRELTLAIDKLNGQITGLKEKIKELTIKKGVLGNKKRHLLKQIVREQIRIWANKARLSSLTKLSDGQESSIQQLANKLERQLSALTELQETVRLNDESLAQFQEKHDGFEERLRGLIPKVGELEITLRSLENKEELLKQENAEVLESMLSNETFLAGNRQLLEQREKENRLLQNQIFEIGEVIKLGHNEYRETYARLKQQYDFQKKAIVNERLRYDADIQRQRTELNQFIEDGTNAIRQLSISKAKLIKQHEELIATMSQLDSANNKELQKVERTIESNIRSKENDIKSQEARLVSLSKRYLLHQNAIAGLTQEVDSLHIKRLRSTYDFEAEKADFVTLTKKRQEEIAKLAQDLEKLEMQKMSLEATLAVKFQSRIDKVRGFNRQIAMAFQQRLDKLKQIHAVSYTLHIAYTLLLTGSFTGWFLHK
jgi:chromosome segregation ATPase